MRKFGIVRERKNPPDKRVVFSPEAVAQLQAQYPQTQWVVETSPIRIFSDQAYRDAGVLVVDDVSDCDVLFGVKEIPVEALIPNKSYFFFSHTIKKQPHNRKLMRALLDKNITLYDHETLVDAQHKRLIGFGRYAGIVGAYNGFRALGLKRGLCDLPKAESLSHFEDLVAALQRHDWPNIKIVMTGHGKVGQGIVDILQGMNIPQVGVDAFLHDTFDHPVYVQLDVNDYNRRTDGQPGTKADFYAHPEAYTSDFGRFAAVSQLYIAGHFYANGAPQILTQEMLMPERTSLEVVADVSCDVDGPIACTLRASTIADPIFGYDAVSGTEVDYRQPQAIAVMSVDNLPCELPKDASIGFGKMFMEHIIPAFFDGDAHGILQRAKVTENGQLCPDFAYLSDYAAPCLDCQPA